MTIAAMHDDVKETFSGGRILFFTNHDWRACRKMEWELRAAVGGRAAMEVIDVMEDPQAAVDHEVLSVPTMLIEVDGSEVQRVVGVAGRRRIRRVLDDVLGSGQPANASASLSLARSPNRISAASIKPGELR